MNNKLNAKQARAPRTVLTTFQPIQRLDAHPATLHALSRLGLVDTTRINGVWHYCINAAGEQELRTPTQQDSPAPSTEDRIRTAYTTLASKPGSWVGLADLREDCHLLSIGRR